MEWFLKFKNPSESAQVVERTKQKGSSKWLIRTHAFIIHVDNHQLVPYIQQTVGQGWNHFGTLFFSNNS